MTKKRVTKKKVAKSVIWLCEDSCQHYDECPKPGDARVCVYARQTRKASHVAKAIGNANRRRKVKPGGTRR